jgi:hypothetical protein
MTNEQSDADFLRELAHYTSTLSHENEARVRRIADLLDTFALEPSAEVKCPCGTAYLRVEGGYVPVCDCAVKNSVTVNREAKP